MQEGNKDCGACALLTIIKTYGGNVSLEYLKDLTRTTKDGTNATSNDGARRKPNPRW